MEVRRIIECIYNLTGGVVEITNVYVLIITLWVYKKRAEMKGSTIYEQRVLTLSKRGDPIIFRQWTTKQPTSCNNKVIATRLWMAEVNYSVYVGYLGMIMEKNHLFIAFPSHAPTENSFITKIAPDAWEKMHFLWPLLIVCGPSVAASNLITTCSKTLPRLLWTYADLLCGCSICIPC